MRTEGTLTNIVVRVVDKGQAVSIEIATGAGGTHIYMCENEELNEAIYQLLEGARSVAAEQEKAGTRATHLGGPAQAMVLPGANITIGEMDGGSSGAIAIDLGAFALTIPCSPGQLDQIAAVSTGVAQGLRAKGVV